MINIYIERILICLFATGFGKLLSIILRSIITLKLKHFWRILYSFWFCNFPFSFKRLWQLYRCSFLYAMVAVLRLHYRILRLYSMHNIHIIEYLNVRIMKKSTIFEFLKKIV